MPRNIQTRRAEQAARDREALDAIAALLRGEGPPPVTEEDEEGPEVLIRDIADWVGQSGRATEPYEPGEADPEDAWRYETAIPGTYVRDGHPGDINDPERYPEDDQDSEAPDGVLSGYPRPDELPYPPAYSMSCGCEWVCGPGGKSGPCSTGPHYPDDI